ncbi:MAG: ribulokinase [Verrucomicrobia bacterium Tous-C9LFEB]|nr:MAG: ribulokinase [Verrucomicrobia bacterium Tous-C9LFEB]
MAYTLGIDYGTNSVRALVVDVATGAELGVSVADYPSGHQGVLLNKNDHHLARQNPADHLWGLETSVRSALEQAKKNAGFNASAIIGIGVDTTGSSPIPVDAHNVPLALNPKWKDNLHAQCWLWKDHTSHQEAAAITKLAAKHRPQYIAKCGNTYSSEWFWSKIWHCLKVAPDVFDAAHSWVELADFIPAVLAGVTDPLQVKRGICCAGHKALYSDEWNGLPDKEFLSLLDPKLASLRDRLYAKAHDATVAAGTLCPEWAQKLGLPAGIPIAIGEMDVHYGAIGSGIKEGVIVKAIGTSTCDCAVVAANKKVADIPGICGIVPGAILPGFYGVEAGQSAVGDIFKWFVEVVCQGNGALHGQLSQEAETQRPGQSGLLALDWNNGNRTILVDPMLTGLLVGQTLYTTRAEIYRALIEGTAYGARAIIERLKEYGVPVDVVVCCGGIAEKSPFTMQLYADITGCTIRVAGSSQACALGAAVSAAVLAGKAKGGYATFPEAQQAMTSLKDVVYSPQAENQKIYNDMYRLYRQLHDAFGGVNKSSDLSDVMKELIRIKDAQNKTI